jgi:hypothetical protein
MNIHQVDSKQTMLNENDIVIVAAYTTDSPPEIQQAAKEHGLTPERMVYAIYVQEMQNPSLIRIRNGNTLFTIAALPDRYGFASMYNGDTPDNVADNVSQFAQAAHKMGFNVLIIKGMDESLKENLESIVGAIQDAESKYDEAHDLLYVQFNEPHGD